MHLLSQLPSWMYARQQPLVAGLLVLTLLAASLGIPILVAPPQDLSQPFPCMSHRCGCGSADACWRGCCCMTLSQKLAWAREHGVTPPAYALAQAKEEAKATAPCGSCCQHRNKRSPEQETVKHDAPSPGVGLGLVLTNDFRRCQGLSTLWLTLSHALPPRVAVSAAPFRPLPGLWLAETSQSAESLALSPATPPPRHSS
jgi:hypothetical protein